MKRPILLTIAALSVAVAVFVISGVRFGASKVEANAISEHTTAERPQKTMRAFRSDQELNEYFHQLAEKQRRESERGRAGSGATDKTASNAAPMGSPSAEAQSGKVSKDEDSVTNTQHAGVDEGGIVKLHGEHLVILRRGRLFTVKVGDNSLRSVDAVNAYAPGVNPNSDWYDEMLIAGDTVVVIGYSYGRGGTEINLFDIDRSGGLEYRSTYHLRSNDYYSSRNYASRLIGNKLIFYTPQYLGYHGDPTERFPAVRKWRKGATDQEFQKIVQPTRLYRAEKQTESNNGMALHTVTVCDLASRDFSCEATGVLGSPGRVFYVSPSSVYVWTTDLGYGAERTKASSMLYKMPLDGSA